jgi:peptide/nickel transport system substrate-binding protein
VNLTNTVKRNRSRQIKILSLCSALIFSACSTPPKPSSSPSPSPTSTTQQQQGTNDTLKLLYWQAPTILNPHFSNGFKDAEASRITLEPLASYDKNGKLIPFLAAEIPTTENGGVAKDGKSVTWKLKKEVKWSDGTPFTAKDVVFTYQFIANPKVATTTAGNYANIKNLEAIDDYTVKISFKEVNPAWFLVFVGGDGMILPRHLFEKYNGANAREAPTNKMPVGTGAYKVVEFKPGDTVVYEPSPYFRDKNKQRFQRIELKGGGDATSAARAIMQTGDADYAYNLQVEAPILQQLELAGKGKALSDPSSLTEQLLINLSDPNKATAEGERSNKKNPHPIFSDIKVRQALAMAIDRDAIARQLYGKTGTATANVLVLPQEYNSPNTSYEFNPQKASALLDEAGWKDTNGNGIRDKNGTEMNLVFQTSVNPLRQKTQQIIKQGLQAIGMGVELKTIDPSIFFSSDPANNDTVEHFYADLQMFSTGNMSPDPGDYMRNFTCQEIPQKANNWTGDNFSRYCNPEYDKLWQAASKELNAEKRKQMYTQMNDMLVKDAIIISLIHRANVMGVSNNLKGVDLTAWDLSTWKLVDWMR